MENNEKKPTPEQIKEIREKWLRGSYTLEKLKAEYPFNIVRIIYNTAYYDPDYKSPIRYSKRGRKGEAHPGAKLDRAKVKSIRFHYSRGASIKSLAEKYGVSYSAISDIVHMRKWKV